MTKYQNEPLYQFLLQISKWNGQLFYMEHPVQKGGVVGGGKTIWHRSTYISKKKKATTKKDFKEIVDILLSAPYLKNKNGCVNRHWTKPTPPPPSYESALLLQLEY